MLTCDILQPTPQYSLVEFCLTVKYIAIYNNYCL